MNNSKTSLFLMELIIVILFFSISAAVCVQLFFNAHKTDIGTNELSHAEIEMQNVIECYLGLDGDLNAFERIYNNISSENSSSVLYYDSSWNAVSDGDISTYYIRITDSTDSAITAEVKANGGYMLEADIATYKNGSSDDDDTLINSQHIEHYIPYTVTIR